MQDKIVGKASVGLLLFLPLVAVGIALALMLTWGHQNAQQASADATTEIEFSISAPGCSTIGGGEAANCIFSVGDSFTLNMSWNGFSGGHSGEAPNVQMVIAWSGAVSGPNTANGKSLINTALPGCDIPVTVLDPGNNPNSAAIACGVLFAVPPTVSTGLMGTAQINCDTVGVGTLLLLHSNAASLATDAALQPHWEDNFSDTLTVKCEPPDEQININLTEAGNSAKKLTNSCYLVSAIINIETNPLSPPNLVKKPVDVVSDNQSQVALCDSNGPIKADLSDKNTANGQIDITISGANRLLFGDAWSIQQVKAGDSSSNPDINYAVDPTNYECDLSTGKCNVGITNVRLNTILSVTFGAKGLLDPNLLTGLCVEIRDGFDKALKNKVCDGGSQDTNGADREISVSLDVNNGFLIIKGQYSIVAQTTKVSGVYELDPTQVPGNGDAQRECDTIANQKCVLTFSYRSQVGDINVIINEVNRKGDVFQLVAGACINVDPGKGSPAADVVCDGDSNDADPAAGKIRYNGVPVGNHTVTAKAPGFKSVTGPVVVAVPAGGKVSTKIDLEFNGIPAVFGMNGAPMNLWLTNQNPDTCNDNPDKASKIVVGTSEPLTRIPKETIDDKSGLITPDKTLQVIAGVEISFLLKDSLANGEVACISVTPGSYWANSSCTISSSGDKQKIDVFCATKKADVGSLNSANLKDMFNITVRVNPVLYSLFTATQDNGTMVQVLTTNCNLTDQLGHAIPNEQCPDGDITIRQLEGDVNRDCKVTAIDQQLLAFRWGSVFPSTLFSQTYNLVDTGVSEINIKDVQFVFGRHNSECDNQNSAGVSGTPNPPQPPLTKK